MKMAFLLAVAFFIAPIPPALAGTFTGHGDATVTDADTRLMWQQTEGGGMFWVNALNYCEGLTLAGYTDWRLPNYKELESLSEDNRANPAINSGFFPDAYAAGYWTSTTNANDSSTAWGVSFATGNVSYGNKSYSNYVRCVR